ncbi:exosortase F system-associated protein [uncultured Polaribacter sp.]|uniref:exosortase F system-associated membrane protein n=1 Tax=uncultured Polaribacter sp. TaxID=174711 RepID=UPI002638E536|nr:exosortase F system-associated protein [uncultured Polaribacter sp.]
MNKFLKAFLLFISIAALFIVRSFAAEVFYDPLIIYFKNDYLYTKIPTLDTYALMLSYTLRYSLNAIITLAIIYTVFEKKDHIKFTSIFLIIAFVILSVAFTFLLNNQFKNGYLLPFYIRRFLIHPLFLLILLPAFYFQKINKK